MKVCPECQRSYNDETYNYCMYCNYELRTKTQMREHLDAVGATRTLGYGDFVKEAEKEAEQMNPGGHQGKHHGSAQTQLGFEPVTQPEESESAEQVEETDVEESAEKSETVEPVEESDAEKSTEESEPAEQEEEPEPVEQVEESETVEQEEETDVEESVDESESAEQVEESDAEESADEFETVEQEEETDAEESTEESEPAEQEEETEAEESVDESESAEQVEETDAEKSVDESESAEQVEETDAEKSVDESESAEQVEETDAEESAEKSETVEPEEESDAEESVDESESVEQCRRVFFQKKQIKAKGKSIIRKVRVGHGNLGKIPPSLMAQISKIKKSKKPVQPFYIDETGRIPTMYAVASQKEDAQDLLNERKEPDIGAEESVDEPAQDFENHLFPKVIVKDASGKKRATGALPPALKVQQAEKAKFSTDFLNVLFVLLVIAAIVLAFLDIAEFTKIIDLF